MERFPSLRAADADRERVAGLLREAMAEGRLSGQELEERLEALFTSRTYGELDALVADLPVNRSSSSPPARAPRWGGAVAASLLVLTTLGMLAIARAHSFAEVARSRARQSGIAGPFADPHRAVAVATSMLGVFAVVLVACAALVWALTRREHSSNA